jgi:hypothetical protein
MFEREQVSTSGSEKAVPCLLVRSVNLYGQFKAVTVSQYGWPVNMVGESRQSVI